jgi:hypothetical protein
LGNRVHQLAVAMLALLPVTSSALAAGSNRFDGTWQTTVSCSAARDALGYSFRFDSIVHNGVLRGMRGVAGQPSSLQIDGTIEPDGTGKLYAKGFTNSKEFVPGRVAERGTEYDYNIDAHFGLQMGTGARVEGRPCSYQFVKQ